MATVLHAVANAVLEEPATKKAKTTKVIGTHSGTFHCDEALAVFLLRLTGQYRGAGEYILRSRFCAMAEGTTIDVKRSREPAVLDTCDIVVDVGAEYVPAKQRYDHHQRGFTEVFGHGFNTKLSSAGLVYK